MEDQPPADVGSSDAAILIMLTLRPHLLEAGTLARRPEECKVYLDIGEAATLYARLGRLLDRAGLDTRQAAV